MSTDMTPRQAGIPDDNLRKYKACFTSATDRTIHGCVYAANTRAAYNMLVPPPPGYSRSVLEVPRTQACFYDSDFTKYVVLEPAAPAASRPKRLALLDEALSERGVVPFAAIDAPLVSELCELIGSLYRKLEVAGYSGDDIVTWIKEGK